MTMKHIKQFFSLCLIQCFLLTATLACADADSGNKVDQRRNSYIGQFLSKQLPGLHFSDKVLDDEQAAAAFDLYIKQLDSQKRFLLLEDLRTLQKFALEIDNNLYRGQIILPEAGYQILNKRIDQVQKMVDQMLAEETVKGLPDGDILRSSRKPTVPRVYTVKSGDSLSRIARKYQDISISDLLRANDLDDAASLDVGQMLLIPDPVITPEGLRIGIFDVSKADIYETDPEKMDFAGTLAELKDRWRKILKMQLISQYLDLEDELEKELEKGEEADREIVDKTDAQLWQEALTKIRKRNSTFFLRLRQETLQDHYDRFFNSVTRAFGPHTNYIPPASKEQFDINMRGSLEGIGALLREEDGFIKVVRIIPGSASARQGRLKAEDIILEVAQEGKEPVDITEMRLRDAVRLIRGPKGEAVTLTVKTSDGAKESITIIRDVVQIEETFVKSTVLRDGNIKVGYIYIPSFYRDFEGNKNGTRGRNSTDDTRAEIEKLKEEFVEGIILDLRDDGGGALTDAVDITGLFIESGPVVQVRDSFGEQKVLRDRNGSVSYDGPLVVLVNKFSASASEILAAALQDYKRAVIVGGKHTHGKGTVQVVIDLNENVPLLQIGRYDDLGALKATIQKFYRIDGGSTQYKGVEPDIILPDLFEHLKSGERSLDYSLPWDSIEPVEFTPWGGTPFDLETIKENSRKRTEKDEAFRIIEKEAAKAAARSKDTEVIIQLTDMRYKREESRKTQEKVGEHYRKFRDDLEDLDDEQQEPANAENLRQKWLDEVNEDPYIKEAANIIKDLIQSKK